MTRQWAPRMGLRARAAARGGPWLGVFTAIPSRWRGSTPIGPQTISFRALQQSARQAGMAMVVFTPEGLRPGLGYVVGHRWSHRRRRWVRLTAPLPDVVYNRVPRRETEADAHVQWALNYLGRQGIPLFNPRFLDKWEVHQVLSRDAACRTHLPATQLLDRDEDVVKALDRWQALVLKPAAGSLGRGVIFLGPARGRPGIRMNAHLGRRHVRGQYKDGAAALHSLRRHIYRRPYLIQQAIRRVNFKGRPVDIRALVQRTGTGEWSLTGMAARVAGWGRVVTHVPQGGTRTSAEHALAPSFGPAAMDRVKDTVHQVSLQAGRALNTGTGELFGELSLDLAVDRQGLVWILECNAKPFRFDEPSIRRTAHRNLVDFAYYLVANHGAPAAPVQP